MGIGDAIMASAAAEAVEHRAVFGNGSRSWWDDIWLHNPKIAKLPDKRTTWIRDYPGNRPYVTGFSEGRFSYNENFRAPYGRIYLSDQEREWAAKQVSGDYVVVEPYVKDSDSSLKLGANKAWDKWDELLKLDIPWLQLGAKAPKTRQVKTESFRQAAAILANAKMVVTTDGALHHAAAALGVPAIVLWGGVVSPKILGYPTHINVWNGAQMCGSATVHCPHCREAMKSITLDQVKKHL